MDIVKLQQILEGAILASHKPVTVEKMLALFPEEVFREEDRPDGNQVRDALVAISESCEDRGFELKKVASGYRFQVKQALAPWVGRLWEEKPQRYTRALLETLALIAYRQPITRGEIEEIRGVAVSSNIIRTLQEREWVRVVGHRDVPGRPAMFATTRQFLDYFNLENLNELPPLAEIRNLEEAAQTLAEEANNISVEEAEEAEVDESEHQTAEELFAELDELEADLPDNFADMIKKQKVEELGSITTETEQPEPAPEEAESSFEATSEAASKKQNDDEPEAISAHEESEPEPELNETSSEPTRH
ncbi:SMC-Scp complex subunit ScpB [Endozoicomonas sp. OPT23]|uniref:SMC-Scp complex subunit ScpB n=1 Tax=Endozoicomonas sp. OPT23 TaxID=2072845 RepID=UPI00129A5FEF|nr:SMC-Scp complex subunit ScpB [Endozoicomonas sp. OPT23]MRI34603.1 SMC-Scp complex subunit ScpB [Endozoicomonas sp. OPT23]